MGQLTHGTLTLKVFKNMITRFNAYYAKHKKNATEIATSKGGSNYITLKYYAVMIKNYSNYITTYKKEPAKHRNIPK